MYVYIYILHTRPKIPKMESKELAPVSNFDIALAEFAVNQTWCRLFIPFHFLSSDFLIVKIRFALVNYATKFGHRQSPLRPTEEETAAEEFEMQVWLSATLMIPSMKGAREKSIKK